MLEGWAWRAAAHVGASKKFTRPRGSELKRQAEGAINERESYALGHE